MSYTLGGVKTLHSLKPNSKFAPEKNRPFAPKGKPAACLPTIHFQGDTLVSGRGNLNDVGCVYALRVIKSIRVVFGKDLFFRSSLIDPKKDNGVKSNRGH